MANNRDLDKAEEWLQRLKAQDLMTVGDLRDLHDEDWASLGLTVFASRALRNALHGKGARATVSPKTGKSTSPPTSGSFTSSMHNMVAAQLEQVQQPSVAAVTQPTLPSTSSPPS